MNKIIRLLEQLFATACKSVTCKAYFLAPPYTKPRFNPIFAQKTPKTTQNTPSSLSLFTPPTPLARSNSQLSADIPPSRPTSRLLPHRRAPNLQLTPENLPKKFFWVASCRVESSRDSPPAPLRGFPAAGYAGAFLPLDTIFTARAYYSFAVQPVAPPLLYIGSCDSPRKVDFQM